MIAGPVHSRAGPVLPCVSDGVEVAGLRTDHVGRLVVVAFDDLGLVCDLPTGRVMIVDGVSRDVLQELLQGVATGEVIRNLARRLGVSEHAAGRRVAAVLRQVAVPSATYDWLALPPAGRQLLDADYAPGPVPVRVRVEGSPGLAGLLHDLLEPARTGAPGRPAAVAATMIRAVRQGRWIIVLRDGQMVARTANLAEARSTLLLELLFASHAGRSWTAVLHAAAVEVAGEAWLLTGESGSGKSTLAATLVARGAGYVTDDFAPIAAADGSLQPVPFALSVKAGAVATLRPLFPGLDRARERRLRGRGVRYIDVPNRIWRPLSVRRLLFPVYDPASAAELVPLTPRDAFLLCAAGGGWYAGEPARLRALVDWFRARPAHLLVYPDTRSALDLMARLAGDLPVVACRPAAGTLALAAGPAPA